MCALHTKDSPKATPKAHPYVIAWLFIALVMMLKISLLLAFYHLNVTLKNAPHKHSACFGHYKERQQRTIL